MVITTWSVVPSISESTAAQSEFFYVHSLCIGHQVLFVLIVQIISYSTFTFITVKPVMCIRTLILVQVCHCIIMPVSLG